MFCLQLSWPGHFVLTWAEQLSQQADLTYENSFPFLCNFLLIYSPNYIVYWSRVGSSVKISSNIQPYNLSRGLNVVMVSWTCLVKVQRSALTWLWPAVFMYFIPSYVRQFVKSTQSNEQLHFASVLYRIQVTSLKLGIIFSGK